MNNNIISFIKFSIKVMEMKKKELKSNKRIICLNKTKSKHNKNKTLMIKIAIKKNYS